MTSKDSSKKNQEAANSVEPMSVGDVLADLWLLNAGMRGGVFEVDLTAEKGRKLQTAEHIAEITARLRQEEIAKAQAGEDYDPELIAGTEQDLLEANAKRAELQQEIKSEQQPPEHP